MVTPILNTVSAMEINQSHGKVIDHQIISTQQVMIDNEMTNIDIISDTKEKRVAKSNFNGIETIAEFDKASNMLTINENGIEAKIDLSQAESNSQDTNVRRKRVAYIEERTFSNFEYKIYPSSDKWILRRPKPGKAYTTNEKSVYANTKNRSNLNNFRDAVDEINILEAEFIFSGASAGISVVASAIASAVTAGAGTALAALGLYGTALSKGLQLEKYQKRALYYYFKV